MSGKCRVGIVSGGRSAEHEVSLQSARNIIDAIDNNKYEVVLIGIDKKGGWHLNEGSGSFLPRLNRNYLSCRKAAKIWRWFRANKKTSLFRFQASRGLALWM